MTQRRWRPIETAPANRLIDVYATNGDLGIGTRIPAACNDKDLGWIDGQCKPIHLNEGKWKLTHWTPIPRGPTAGQE